MAVLSTFGRIVAIYAALKISMHSTLRTKILLSFYLLIEISWHLFSGKREGLFIAILSLILAHFFCRRKIPIVPSIFFILILFLGSSFYNDYRKAPADTSPANDDFVVNSAKKAFDAQSDYSLKQIVNIRFDCL